VSGNEGKAVVFAILETGGKQYKIKPGDVIEVERLDGDVGSQVELGRVLMMAGADGDAPTFGTPLVDGAKVMAEVVEQGKADKITVFKYKPKVRYRRKTGHRQSVTRLRITDILAGEK
jgi:large subunit ribosomal protein L21